MNKDQLHKDSEDCQCSGCHSNLPISDSSRRNFIKQSAALGLSSLVGPKLAGLVENSGNVGQKLSTSSTVKAGKAKHFTLLHTADIHAQLYTHDEFFLENNRAVYKKRGGFAVLKTMLDSLRKENPTNTLLIDGGDCFQGGGVAAMSDGAAIVPLVNNMGYDLVLPGNWEVVYGKEAMLHDLGAYEAQKICANMFHADKDTSFDDYLYPPYWIKTLAGFKLGFIGYNDPLTPIRQSPAYSVGIQFTKPIVNAAKIIKYLREYEKCQMVIVLSHMGLAQQIDLANQSFIEGVDYILGADTHERVRQPLQGKYAKVTEPGAFGSFVSKLDFLVENGVVKDQNYQLLDVDPEQYKPDEEMSRLVEEVRAPYRKQLDKVIGQSKTPLVRYYVIENPMDNLVTDALMWKFPIDVVLSNGFRFCPPLIPDPKTGVADITNDYLWSMLPVDSEVKQGEATGKQIWDWMEKELNNVFAVEPAERFGGWVVRFQGMKLKFSVFKGKGKRVESIEIQGQPIDMDKLYSILACEREGDPIDTLCRMAKIKSPHMVGLTLHQVMREYLAVHSPVSPKVDGRAIALDAPHDLLSQLDGYPYTFT